MSVTFFASLLPIVNDDSLYDLHNEHIVLKDKEIYDIIKEDYNNDIGFYFYNYVKKNGPQPYSFWIDEFSKFGELVSEFKNYSLYISAYRNGKLAIEFYLGVVDPEKEAKNVQMSNTNARVILQLLNLDYEELSGSINPIAMMKKIDNVKGSRLIDEFTRDYEQVGNIYSSGIDRNYIEDKLLRLEDLADYCVRKECEIGWG